MLRLTPERNCGNQTPPMSYRPEHFGYNPLHYRVRNTAVRFKLVYSVEAVEPKPILNFALRSFMLFSIDRVCGRWRMTQTQMTAYLADKIGISKRQAKSALDELNELVTRQLKKEGLLRLAGLGVFRKRKLKARMGRNPATGEQIKIPARTRLRFTPAKALKDSVLGAR